MQQQLLFAVPLCVLSVKRSATVQTVLADSTTTHQNSTHHKIFGFFSLHTTFLPSLSHGHSSSSIIVICSHKCDCSINSSKQCCYKWYTKCWCWCSCECWRRRRRWSWGGAGRGSRNICCNTCDTKHDRWYQRSQEEVQDHTQCALCIDLPCDTPRVWRGCGAPLAGLKSTCVGTDTGCTFSRHWHAVRLPSASAGTPPHVHCNAYPTHIFPHTALIHKLC